MTHNIDTRSTIGDILDIQTQRFAEREALVHAATGDRFNYREFHAEVERVARGLLSIGIEKGQHVGIWATNYNRVGARPVCHCQDRAPSSSPSTRPTAPTNSPTCWSRRRLAPSS